MALPVQSHLRILLLLTISSRLFTILLLGLSSFLPQFDSSAQAIPISRWLQPLLRWDAFHFAHVSKQGYLYEHEWAFFPGAPWIMRASAKVLQLLTRSGAPSDWGPFLQGAAIMALACDTPITLYHLSVHHLRSPSVAFIAASLSLLPSSPVTLYLAACSEPFFTYLSYKGMLYCARSQWLAASLCFTLAGTLRSNGILLSGFILWGLVIQPFIDGKKPSFRTLGYSVLLTATIFVPFVYHHYTAYHAFCTTLQPAEWCSKIPPSIYTYAQSKYWNVGFLRYWTLQQLPNFVISAPPLITIFIYSIHFFLHGIILRFAAHFSDRPSSKPASSQGQPKSASSPFLRASLTPHAIHAFILCTTLLFASHTQIVLRLAASMPFTYWAAAWLVVEHPKQGRWWVGWSLIWGVLSIVLWGTFLPPA